MAAVPILDEIERADGERGCLEAARSGDAAAIAQLYAWYRPLLLGRVRARWGICTDLAEDLVHDAWVKALGRLDGVDSERPLGPWLEKILDNGVIDHLRKTRTRDGHVRQVSLATTGTARPVHHPEARPEDTDRLADREALTSAMADLPSRQRQIALSVLVTGASVAEAAKGMELDLGAGRQLLFRARQRLRRSLLEQGVLPGFLPPVLVVRHWWADLCRRCNIAVQGVTAAGAPTLAAFVVAAAITVAAAGESIAMAQDKTPGPPAQVTAAEGGPLSQANRPAVTPEPELMRDAPDVVASDASAPQPEPVVSLPEAEVPFTGVRIHQELPPDPYHEYGVRVEGPATAAPGVETEFSVQDRQRDETDPVHGAGCEVASRTPLTYCARTDDG